jgi:hypothetical protein
MCGLAFAAALLTICWLVAPLAKAQVATSGHRNQSRSGRYSFGALGGVNGGQTLWMAPADGKIGVFVTQDYVVPRKMDSGACAWM